MSDFPEYISEMPVAQFCISVLGSCFVVYQGVPGCVTCLLWDCITSSFPLLPLTPVASCAISVLCAAAEPSSKPVWLVTNPKVSKNECVPYGQLLLTRWLISLLFLGTGAYLDVPSNVSYSGNPVPATLYSVFWLSTVLFSDIWKADWPTWTGADRLVFVVHHSSKFYSSISDPPLYRSLPRQQTQLTDDDLLMSEMRPRGSPEMVMWK